MIILLWVSRLLNFFLLIYIYKFLGWFFSFFLFYNIDVIKIHLQSLFKLHIFAIYFVYMWLLYRLKIINFWKKKKKIRVSKHKMASVCVCVYIYMDKLPIWYLSFTFYFNLIYNLSFMSIWFLIFSCHVNLVLVIISWIEKSDVSNDLNKKIYLLLHQLPFRLICQHNLKIFFWKKKNNNNNKKKVKVSNFWDQNP